MPVQRSGRVVTLMACGVLVLGAAACQKQHATTTAAPASVRVVQAVNREIEVSAEYAARMMPAKTVTITPKVSGRVSEVRVDVGDTVTQGSEFFALDPTDYAAQYRQAQAALAGAEANLARTNDSSIGQEVLTAQSAVQQAQVQLDNVTSDYDKSAKLFQAGVISKQQYDDMSAKYQSAQIQLRSASEPCPDPGEVGTAVLGSSVGAGGSGPGAGGFRHIAA